MVKRNQLDIITDKVNSRMDRILGRVSKRLGGSNPYRQEPVSRKEMMMDFDDMMSREVELRQEFGDEIVDSYKQAMEVKLGGK